MTIEEELTVIALQNEAMREALYKLACLGNGDQFGNSIGNSIAQDALNLPNIAAEILRKRDAEKEKNAARYMWLRNKPLDSSFPIGWYVVELTQRGGKEVAPTRNRDELDNAIDAAIDAELGKETT